MIQAKAAQSDDRLLLQISYPGEKKPAVYKYVINEKEASIVVYRYYRDYIFDMLNKWLKQRIYGLKEQDPYRAQMADQLRAVLSIFEKATLGAICKYVAGHAENFRYLSPSLKSKNHYKHYDTRIIPVLNLCEELIKEV